MMTWRGCAEALTHAGLTPVDRSMVLLRFGIDVRQALSVAEIATVLGLSRDMVYRRLKDGLALLRRLMDEDLECQGRHSRSGARRHGVLAHGGPGHACDAQKSDSSTFLHAR